jgi:hypothetical protein
MYLLLLERLKAWVPFRINVLGIVTLLGTPEMNQSISSLARCRFTEYLPLLAAHMIAQNGITKPIPGFVLYNITDGITAHGVASWFCRWALAQTFSWYSSVWCLSNRSNRTARVRAAVSVVVAVLVINPLLILAVLSGDWYALTNALSILIAILCRAIIVGENHEAVNAATIATRDQEWARQYMKTILKIPNGRIVTMYAPRGIITNVLLTIPQPPRARLYLLVRRLAWLGFGVHVISIGMSALVNQILVVAVLLVSTVLVASRVCCDETSIGSELGIKRFDEIEGKESRSRAYCV